MFSCCCPHSKTTIFTTWVGGGSPKVPANDKSKHPLQDFSSIYRGFLQRYRNVFLNASTLVLSVIVGSQTLDGGTLRLGAIAECCVWEPLLSPSTAQRIGSEWMTDGRNCSRENSPPFCCLPYFRSLGKTKRSHAPHAKSEILKGQTCRHATFRINL